MSLDAWRQWKIAFVVQRVFTCTVAPATCLVWKRWANLRQHSGPCNFTRCSIVGCTEAILQEPTDLLPENSTTTWNREIVDLRWSEDKVAVTCKCAMRPLYNYMAYILMVKTRQVLSDRKNKADSTTHRQTINFPPSVKTSRTTQRSSSSGPSAQLHRVHVLC